MGGLVSVIVPVYNIKPYLAECVESILNQTYGNFELLLIDDGSTDGSSEICDEFAEKDSRVIVIHKQNEGPSATRNRGIEKAKGEYIVFVDSDDLIHSQMLEQMHNAITKYGTDLVICGFERFCENWRQPYRLSPYSLIILQSRKELAGVYTQPNTNMFGVSIWAKMYRTDIIKNNGIRFRVDVDYEEDCLFNLDYFRHITTTAALNDYFYFYRQMDQSLSKGYRKNRFKFLVNGYRQRKAFMEELGVATDGADVIFTLVVKMTLQKIYNSDLPKNEKLEEYKAIISFAESQDACRKSRNSKNRETRKLSRTTLTNNPKKVHRVLVQTETEDKIKGVIKKVLRRLKK